ncbi:MAG: histidine kinase [Cyclobacteriaceae bacterium]|nr:histidine kinase [Cyclobacteriaceae bacterium]
MACSSLGLVEIDESKNVKVYEGREPQEHTELITSILRDKYDRIWISGKKGVSIWNNSQWHQLPDQTDSVPVGAISMIMDSEQNIWLGGTDGLYFYDYKKLQKIAPGILNTQIGVLNLTDDEKLLIGSIGLLALVDLAEFYNTGKATVRTYDHNSGFNGGECKHNSSFKDNEGNIWICTSNGVVKVNPKDLVPNPYTPRIYTRAVTSDTETIMLKNTPTDTIISLNPEKRNLRFNYRAISHAAPHLVRYRTQLTGYDSDWSGRNLRALPQLHQPTVWDNTPLWLRRRNGDGVWAGEPASVSFRILPAWYEKLWVKIAGILGAMAFTAVIGYLFSERKRRMKQKEEVAERNMAKLQFRSLKGMIDPHFTFNALNSIASMVYQGNRDEAYGYFTKFSRLIRNVFEHAEHTTRTLEEELEFVTNYLDIEKMRFGDKFSYTIHCEAGIDKSMEIPKLLIQIYVENALKHGLMWLDTGGLLEVNILNRARGVEIAIRDNGPGRSQAKQTGRQRDGLGKGTMILHEYFHLLNRFNDKKLEAETIDLFNDQGAAAGTEVRIILPYDFKYSL